MEGKVALVTGASSGIGAGIAILFASRGCYLALTGRNVEGLENTRLACIEAGTKEDNVLLIPADLQVKENIAVIMKQTVNKFGKLDVLIHNAGCNKPGSVENALEANYDLVMNTNLKSVFFLTQLALPHLVSSKGNIVNISGAISQRPSKVSVVYSMSKAALDHFTRNVALDMASKGVRVNSVNPGGVKTKFQERAGYTINIEERLSKLHAMGRGAKIDEVAKAVLFLADNEQSSFITGVTMLVDGGFSLMGPM